VRVPTPLLRLTGGKVVVEAEGKNISELIEDLEKKYPGIKERICEKGGEIKRFVNVFVNEEDIRFLKGKETELNDGDEVSFIPAIAGGGLNEGEIERYSRQIILSEVGGVGQEKLLNSSVLVVGAGGLGSPVLLYLAAAGVGRIGIVDSDKVELNNLQRQIVHNTKDVGKEKVKSAKETLLKINPQVRVETYGVKLNSSNALDIVSSYDLVIDGSDNFATRYLLNDSCVMLKRPLVEAAILRFEGQIMSIIPGKGACYRCLFPEPPPPDAVPNCQQAGILGPVAGVMGSLQAIEALKILLGKGSFLKGKLLIVDTLNLVFHLVNVRRNLNCAVCGDEPKIQKLIDYEEWCARR
jgi:adenylyltransferase/sulfurtransferase